MRISNSINVMRTVFLTFLASTALLSGCGKDDSPVDSASERQRFLEWAAACRKVTSGDIEGSSYDFILRHDIDLTGVNWAPIGASETRRYCATFDGGGHTIKGFGLGLSQSLREDNWQRGKYTGLFVSIGIGGTVRNLAIEGDVTVNGINVGGVCGLNLGGTIENCSFIGTVWGGRYVGGICGSNGGVIENCSFAGNVKGMSNYIGGICGYNEDIIKGCSNSGSVIGQLGSVYYSSVGGVCGENREGTIEVCSNSGSVTGYEYVGGVCGRNDYGAVGTCSNSGSVTGNYHVGGVCGINIFDSTIEGCMNSGSVEGRATGGMVGSEYIGGISGNNYDNTSVRGCSNSGSVKGNYSVGGVCGYNESSSTIEACFNNSKVYGGGDRIGIICGYNDSVIDYCYWSSLPRANDNNAVNGIGDGAGNAVELGENWPVNDPSKGWGVVSALRPWGTAGCYWKSLGGWNNGSPVFPELYFPPAE